MDELLTAVEREESLEFLKQVVSSVNIPVVISSGDGANADFDTAKKSGASVIVEGSFFIY